MNRIVVVCDGCGKELLQPGKSDPVGAIRIYPHDGRRHIYVVKDKERSPMIGADFCSLKCLVAKVESLESLSLQRK